ncbi:unannotated protein [freshwater metagenome]|uniref:Unannotated protein n=1 Tax=freshwater metagenome TaxID=449393 RepID=A0A6J7VRR9_9ZZZZ
MLAITGSKAIIRKVPILGHGVGLAHMKWSGAFCFDTEKANRLAREGFEH